MDGFTIQSVLFNSDSRNPREDIKTGIYRIPKNYKAVITGGDGNRIYYGTYRDIPGCSKDVCVGASGYKKCINGILSPTVEYCDTLQGEECIEPTGIPGDTEAQCGLPVTVQSAGFTKTAYTTSEGITLNLRITSASTTFRNGYVDVYLWRAGQAIGDWEGNAPTSETPVSITRKNNIDFTSNDLVTISLPSPSSSQANPYGKYYITFAAVVGSKTQKLGSFEE